MDLTILLEEARSGSNDALQTLVPLVYDELRRVASNHLHSAGPGQTMVTTELVHETFLKLVGSRHLTWENRGHFFSIAATSMRQIVIDHARARHADKRGGQSIRVPFDETFALDGASPGSMEELDDALRALGKADARSARIVEFRFFAGLTNEEIAELLHISVRTVIRDWEFSRAWLFRFMNDAHTD